MTVSFKKCNKKEWEKTPFYTIYSQGMLVGEIFFYERDTDPTIRIDNADLSIEDLTAIVNKTIEFNDTVYKENIGPEN